MATAVHTTKISDILKDYIDESEESFDEIVKRIVSYCNSAVKAANAASAASAANVTKGGGKKAAAGGEPKKRGAGKYPLFVKLCSAFNKGTLEIDRNVVPVDNFKDKTKGTYTIFETKLSDMIGGDDEGIPFREFADRVYEAADKNHVRGAAICWGMLSDSTRDELLALQE